MGTVQITYIEFVAWLECLVGILSRDFCPLCLYFMTPATPLASVFSELERRALLFVHKRNH